MSQHDMDIANASGAAVRADLNLALAALATLSSGATAPATTFAYMWWADTTTGILKQRNAANSAWISVLNLATGVPVGGAASGANSDITSLSALTSAISEIRQIQPISASVAGNALTISASALSLEFRSTTLGSGAVTLVKGTPASLTVSSGSTLGTVSGQQSRLFVLAINNAGTIELAVCGGNALLDETNLISTTAEGGVGGADSASTIYSTTARTSVAYRVIGYIESTQATAGTWATSPSSVQGSGGNALPGVYGFGNGQAWGSVTRTSGTTYYNTTGKPLALMTQITTGAGVAGSVSININGTGAMTMAYSFNANATNACGFCTIPVGASYVLTDTSLTARTTWEMR